MKFFRLNPFIAMAATLCLSACGGGSASVDITAPTAPTGLVATASATRVDLSWTASADDVGVVQYRIYRNGSATALAELTGTSYSDTAVSAGANYSYRVLALDAAGNASALSSASVVTTLGASQSTCALPKPGAGNTGVPAGAVLTPSGDITVTTNGAVIENLDIHGSITVLANNVTIRRVRLTSGDYYPVRYFDNNNVGLLVEDTEIISTSGNVTSGIAFANYTARRVNVHGSADGLKADSNVLIEDSWIHDLSNGPGEHNDDVQSTGGKGVTIRHSVLEGASNAAVQTGDEGGAATEDLRIECSWLSGGGYTLNIRGSGATRPINTQIINNRFGHDFQYGPWTLDDPGPVVTGNVFDDTGNTIPYP